MNNPAPRNILAIAAHPDDEVLGCGGTLALHVDRGDRVAVLIACEGESLRYGVGAVNQADDIQRAAKTLGIHEIRCLGFADQKLDTLNLVDIITPLEKVVDEIQPDLVYCQYGGDINRDHYMLFQAALVATRPLAEFLRGVYAFETASSTEWAYPRSFVPDTWIDIAATLDRKIDAMACYRSEVRDYPHPRSLEALRYRAAYWGNQVALRAAEVFMTVRQVLRNGETPV
ncbi:MAG: PIG-L family deacetylase [Pirellulales bacterium]|nr:PIG-L family deacetylase [Pirellulales bacterium]